MSKNKLITKFKTFNKNRTFSTVKESSIFQKIKNLEFLNSFKTVLFLMLFVLFYYAFIAADRFVSEATINVRSTSNSIAASSVSGLASLLGSTAVSSEDLSYLKVYIHSLDMFKILDEKIKIRSLYEEQKKDIFFRIKQNSTQEQALKFYQERVKVITDTNGLLNLQVEGFTPEQAHQIALAILSESERFVNEISHKNAREQMIFAENELNNYKDRYKKAEQDLLAFQNKYGVFDPLKQAEAKIKLNAELEAQIASKEAELGALLSFVNENAPRVQALKAEIKALNEQLEKEKAKILGTSDDRLNELAAQFQELSFEAGFAKDAYLAALKSFETTRIETIRKIKQLVVVQSPTLPQDPLYPKKLYNIFTIFVVLSLIFGIVKLIKTIVEEHRY